jgi:heme oxygenase
MRIAHALKSATLGLHQQTEALMPSAALLDGSLGLEAYAQLISALYRIHALLEQPLQTALQAHPRLAGHYQPQLPSLAHDLQALEAATPCPAPPTTLPDHSAATLAGMMYVLQGATLGGQVILKGLKKNERLAHLPHQYYTGHGPQTGEKWKSFVETLEAVVPPQELGAAVEGANFTFNAFLAQLRQLQSA